MNLRVGFPAYINSLPFHLPFSLGIIPSHIELFYAVPSELNQMFAEQTIDIALTSSVATFNTPCTSLPGYGIAAYKQVMSVNLYTKIPPFQLGSNRLAITNHSATSLSLLKILCSRLWHIDPEFIPLDPHNSFSNYTAFLLIGDEALAHPKISGYHTIDLAAAWYALTSLPFVFALFLIREGISVDEIATFCDQLDQALKWSQKNQPMIEQEALKQCNISVNALHRYYSLLRFQLGKEESEGLNTFKHLREST